MIWQRTETTIQADFPPPRSRSNRFPHCGLDWLASIELKTIRFEPEIQTKGPRRPKSLACKMLRSGFPTTIWMVSTFNCLAYP
ncbi:hypothetical protein RBSH_00848 [Rhodopirellula baltica SH28]|uniref:Uncharacterized protein n=1 Tax=Rhodopirellula baltica SH28 TaxID=993517 RepID=K5DLG4_RHOBT|nr:hypothetical protein RBSH_00848 [Rhodopirellula baltica SH28]